MMKNEKSEFWEAVTDVSRFAGALAGAAVVAGKKLVRYVSDLTAVDTTIKPPAESGESKSKTNSGTDQKN